MYYFIRVGIGSISGYSPVALLMALFHLAMRQKDKRNNQRTPIRHVVTVYLFCFALYAVLAVTDVANFYNLGFDPLMNWTPFVDLSANPIDYALNVILFIPIGFMLPMLWRKFESWHLTFLYGFLFSLSVEFAQLFNSRITDVDDLLTNTLGTVVGYFLFLLTKRMSPILSGFTIDAENHWKFEPYLGFGFVWLSMLLIQPLIQQWIQPYLSAWLWKSPPIFQ